MSHDPARALERIFGFAGFRPGQREAVDAALAGRDALVVMPTGSGKSLCYQLPALAGERLCLVVSPLVSLMQDQVERMTAIAPGRVGVVNSQQGPAANAATLEAARAGELRLLYVAPERFSTPGFADVMRAAGVELFVVDEAHCVSHWGHDFRPEYFTLADAAQAIGARATMALTATATPQVATDIVRRLRLRDPVRVATGFDRPALSFAAARCRGEADKHARLLAALRRPGGLPGIVYAGTREVCQRLARRLAADLERPVAAYHAGLGRGERAEVHGRFMSGEIDLIVATNAFGMGVDKADVRTVCHVTVPQSLEALYQEAGRAGRDGAPALALLLAESRDKGLHVFFIQRSQVPDGAFHRVAERLTWSGLGGRYDVPYAELARTVGPKADADGARAVVGHLARAGVLAPQPGPPERAIGQVLTGLAGRGLAVAAGAAREAERIRWRQYREVWAYAEGTGCRRGALLAHFGDTPAARPDGAGGCCDVCHDGLVPEPAVIAASSGSRSRARTRSRRDAAAGAGAGRAGASRAGAAGSRRPVTAVPGELDAAITATVAQAVPPVGRTRAVEILRGGRSKVVAQHAYDALPHYGAFAGLRSDDVLERVDELIAAGWLSSTGGRFPKLALAAGSASLDAAGSVPLDAAGSVPLDVAPEAA